MKKMLKRGFVGGGVLDAPRRGQRLAAHNERRQFASRTRSCGCLPRRGKHCSLPGFASLNRGPALATPQPFPANPLKNGDAAINLRAGHTRPLQGGALFLEGNKNYLSILHVSKLLVMSPWMRVDTRSTNAAGSSFMPVRTHSSVRPTKAYL